MAKQIRRDHIFIAPDILGWRHDDGPKAFDLRIPDFLDPTDIDDKIIIYERQVKEWFLKRGTNLLRGENNGFVVLMICLSYFEGVELYKRGVINGRNQSSFHFRESVNRIYPNRFSEVELNSLYSSARCGLFHAGMVNAPIIISTEYYQPIEFVGQDTIKINHKILLQDIKNDFNRYISDLKKDHLLRQNFDRCFSNI